MRITAQSFIHAFVEAYEACRKGYAQDSQALCSGTRAWNDFMFKKAPAFINPANNPARPGSVMQEIAAILGIEYGWLREPLRLDGAFWRPDKSCQTVIGNLPFPMLVAFEHENRISSFSEEIARLLCVRAPLKVGITYLKGARRVSERRQRQQCRLIKEASTLSRKLPLAENPSSEYLFLIGVEKTDEHELEWWAYSFSAGNGPSSGSWRNLTETSNAL
jgi:hypothetical protein